MPFRRALIAAVVAAAAGPAPALAQEEPAPGPSPAFERKTFRGETQQDRPVSVTSGEDGLVDRVRIEWVGACRRGAFRYSTRTVDVPPFDVSEATRLRDAYSYRERSRGGVVATVAVTLTGARRGTGRRERWSGTFRARVTVRRDGRTVDSCRTATLRWSARRVSRSARG